MANFESTTTERDAAKKLRETQQAMSQAAFKAKETVGQMSDKIVSEIKQRSQDMQKNVTNYVRKEPIKAMGIAVLSGIVFSWLLRRIF